MLNACNFPFSAFLSGCMLRPILGAGTYPTADPYGRPFSTSYMPDRHRVGGKPIAGEYRFLFDGVQADQDYCRLLFGLNRFFSKTSCCAFCKTVQHAGGGHNSNMLYTNFSPTAPHKETNIASCDEWVATHGENPLLSVPGFWPHERVLPDWMHLVDLAISPDLIGSLLLDITDNGKVFAGLSRDLRLSSAFECYRNWCNVNRVQDRCMSRMFSTATLKPGLVYPHISQRTMSATASRFVIQWLAGLMRQVASHDPCDDHKRLLSKQAFSPKALPTSCVSLDGVFDAKPGAW